MLYSRCIDSDLFKKKLLLAIFFLLIQFNILAECKISKEEWLNKLSEIEEAEIPITKKIANCNRLQNDYLKCANKKDSIYARIIHRLGDFFNKNGDNNKAISYTKEAVLINKSNTQEVEKAYLAHSYYNLGVFFKAFNLINESLNYFDSAINISEHYPEKNFIALMAYNESSFLYFLIGDFQKSIEVSSKGILLANDIQDPLSESILLTQKAQSELYLDEIASAETNIQKAIKTLLKSSSGKEFLATSYYVYSRLMIEKKDYKKAIYFYNKSFNLNKEISNWKQCVGDLIDLGSLYTGKLNHHAKAIEIFLKAVEYNELSKDNYELVLIYNNIGQVYWKLKDYNKALSYYQKGINSLPINFKDTSISNNPSTSKLKLVNNNYFVCLILGNKAESLLEKYKATNNPDFLKYSLATHKCADFMIDQMRQQQQREESKLYWRELSKEIYANAIETCFLLNDPTNAFFFFEKSRAVLLNDLLKELNAKNFLSQKEQIKEQELRLKISTLQKQLTAYSRENDNYSDIQQELFRSQEKFEKYIKSIEKKNPSYYEYKYKTAVPTIEEVKKHILKGHKTLVEYFTIKDYLYILTINPDSAGINRIDVKNFSALVNELNSFCANKTMLNQNYYRFAHLSHRLYNTLFKHISITTKSVIISPDEQFMPCEVLLTDEKDPNSFLVHKYTLSYTYSASTLLNKSSSGKAENFNLLGIAPVNFMPHLNKASLQGADESLVKIKKYFSSTSFLLKDSATKEDFLKKLPYYSIVQLYSHAEADTTGKEPLLYFYDSILHVNELQNLSNLKTNLIILSACKTGIGKTFKGEGVFSLARSFASAGIPTTITNLWEIDNKSTYHLTELFYKYLNQDHPFDEALQKAKIEFLENSDKEQILPYFWASSIIIGQTDVVKGENYFVTNIFIFSMCAILLALFIYQIIIRRRKRNTSGKPHLNLSQLEY